MYAKYSYLANTSQANLMDDIVLLLTGTTDKTLLSASCDQANTQILTNYDSAGWTLHDAAAGANSKVIKAACAGDAAQFKYVKVSTNTAGLLMTGLWEDWNATSHVGTNLTYNSETSGYVQRYSTTQAGTVYISASLRRIVLWCSSPAGNGPQFSIGSFTAILEADRGYTWCAVGRGYTPVGYGYGSYYGMPRHVAPDGNTYVAGGTQGVLVCMGRWLSTTSGMSPSGGIGIPMSDGFGLYLSEMAAANNGATSCLVSGFSTAEVYCSWSNYANTLDETTFNGKTFIMFPVNDNGAGTKLAVPKG